MMYDPQSLIEHIFIFSDYPVNAERGNYLLSLVLLSVIVSVIGAFTSLTVIKKMFTCKSSSEATRYHILSVICLSVTIWSMHFIGMLAYDMDMVHTYSIPITMLSMVAAAVVSFGFVYIVRFFKLRFIIQFFAALFLGGAVCVMHYSGMLAMKMDADILYKPDLWLLSIGIAVVASFVGINIIYKLKEQATLLRLCLSSLVIGVAICGMHYTGMLATVFLPYADCRFSADQTYYPLAIGVTLFSGLVFIASYILGKTGLNDLRNLSYKNFSRLMPAIILMSGVAIITFSVTLTEEFIKRTQHDEFARLSHEIESAIVERYKLYEHGLRGGLGLFEASTYVSLSEWQKFVASQNVYKTFPGINGIGFIEYLRAEELETFNQVQSLEHGRPFVNHPETTYDDKFIIKYIEPVEINVEAVGLDIGFEKNRREAAEASIKTGLPTLTKKIDLVQDNQARAGFLLLMPLFSKDGHEILGWVYAPFIGENFLKDLNVFGSGKVTFAVYDGESTNAEDLIYKDSLFDQGQRGHKLLLSEVIDIQGQKWTIVFKPTALFKSSIEAFWPLVQIVVGLVITLLLAFIVHNLNNRAATIKRLVEKQTSALAEERKFSELVINTIPDLIFVKDEEFRIVKANQSFIDIYPKSQRDRIIGYTTIEHFSKEEADVFLAEDRKAFETGESRTHEQIELFNGRKITIDTLKVRFEDIDGRKYILGVARDVSELHKIQENLEQTVEERTAELKMANEAKDMFLANMSHELRTPLNSIIGLVRILMQEEDIPNEHIRTLSVVDKSSTSLLEIVNDILDISKIEAGKIELESLPFNISGLTFSLLDQLRPLASKKGLELRSNEEDLPVVNAIGDEFRLSRVILNLASNAIKYTNEGYVELCTSIKEVDDETLLYRCVVKDTGIGIPEDKLESVFDKFTQAEESIERRFGGTGLGLNITRHLVDLMGGSIDVQSEFGKGSSFTVSIPFKKSDAEGAPRQADVEIARKREERAEPTISIGDAKILVAEDHQFNQIFIMKLLKRFGAPNYNLVSDGKAALKAFEKDVYDLVLTDCHMPKMNGYEVTRAIRQKEEDTSSDKHGTHTPIVAMTADAMVGTREACIEAGMDDYISKPIMEEELKALLAEWFIIEGETKVLEKSDDQESPANLDILKEYADNDPEVEKELLNVFYDKSEADIKILQENLDGGTNKEWSEAAHSLKGSAGYVGAKNLHHLCAQAQDMLQATGRERQDMFAEIKAEYKKVCDFLKSLA
ncbi:MAG: CHASE domain-containing protein [Bdellovibrionales bacterium]